MRMVEKACDYKDKQASDLSAGVITSDGNPFIVPLLDDALRNICQNGMIDSITLRQHEDRLILDYFAMLKRVNWLVDMAMQSNLDQDVLLNLYESYEQIKELIEMVQMNVGLVRGYV